jgi:hypothetical protein
MNPILKTPDEKRFDYMANSGQEEKDRDTVGLVIAIVIITVLTIFQYLGLY